VNTQSRHYYDRMSRQYNVFSEDIAECDVRCSSPKSTNIAGTCVNSVIIELTWHYEYDTLYNLFLIL